MVASARRVSRLPVRAHRGGSGRSFRRQPPTPRRPNWLAPAPAAGTPPNVSAARASAAAPPPLTSPPHQDAGPSRRPHEGAANTHGRNDSPTRTPGRHSPPGTTHTTETNNHGRPAAAGRVAQPDQPSGVLSVMGTAVDLVHDVVVSRTRARPAPCESAPRATGLTVDLVHDVASRTRTQSAPRDGAWYDDWALAASAEPDIPGPPTQGAHAEAPPNCAGPQGQPRQGPHSAAARAPPAAAIIPCSSRSPAYPITAESVTPHGPHQGAGRRTGTWARGRR